MGEYPDFDTSDRHGSRREPDEAESSESTRSLQEIAHDRGRICKKRGCVVCAPLVERRREKKQQRKAEAQARLHAKAQPCGRASCEVAACVDARTAAASSPPESLGVEPPAATSGAATPANPDRTPRRQAERHRVNLPCGSQDCPIEVCVDGFANERTRRHRAGRPCRSVTCDNAICVSARSTS